MTAIEIARRLTELEQTYDACRAYALVPSGDAQPEELMEAAVYLLQNSEEYKLPYDVFLRLYHDGHFCEDIFSIMTFAFYEPNVRDLRSRYEKNCKRLGKYPYLFRKDFPPFEELPLQFFPYDDDSYVPFDKAAGKLEDRFIVNDPVISRNFFRDLEKPVLAADVFSQYELEYLCDNVRKSEDIGRENHIYLHYTNWELFCAYLQVLDLEALLKRKKIVFLIEDEIVQYPIDFKERFDIDYSRYSLKPVGIREITRLIWHTQLSTHNGGDFFNEIMDRHPNLLFLSSYFFGDMEDRVAELRKLLGMVQNVGELMAVLPGYSPEMMRDLYSVRNGSDKDLMVAYFLLQEPKGERDLSARIAPALFFQPHFPNITFEWKPDSEGKAVLYSKVQERIRDSALFAGFKYIKTFTPMRRFTTSRAAALRFVWFCMKKQTRNKQTWIDFSAIYDLIRQYVLDRGYLQDMSEHLYHDSVIVRFEDGKLNSAATFRALASFLDLPYTESMTYCSDRGKVLEDGFRTSTVFTMYEEFNTPSESAYLEYLLRDAYAFYGYDFHFYDGKEVDEETVRGWIDGFTKMDYYMKESWLRGKFGENPTEADRAAFDPEWAERLKGLRYERLRLAKALMGQQEPRFVNQQGKPLEMTPLLQPDPAYMERELYH